MTFADDRPPATPRRTARPSSVDAPRGFLSLRARIFLGMLLLVGVGGFIAAFAFLSPAADDPPADRAIKVAYPSAGDQVLRQDSIYIELDPSYTGRIETMLVTGGEEIDVRQAVDYIDGLNRYSYTPDADSPTGVLKPGRHCATAYYWEVGQPEDSGRRYSWCFSVH